MERREAARNPRRQLHLPSSNSLAVKNSRPNGHCNPAHLPETRTKSCSTFLVVTLESRDIADSYVLRLPACTRVHISTSQATLYSMFAAAFSERFSRSSNLVEIDAFTNG